MATNMKFLNYGLRQKAGWILGVKQPFNGLATLTRVLLVAAILLAVNTTASSNQISDTEKITIESYITSTNTQVSDDERKLLVDTILEEAKRLELNQNIKIDGAAVNPYYFVAAFIKVESTFYRKAVSSANARGYMQLMPQTVAWMDGKYGTKTTVAELFVTQTNVSRGVSYLNILLSEFDNPRKIALAYNAGPGNVKRGYYVERYWTKIHKAYRELLAKEQEFRSL